MTATLEEEGVDAVLVDPLGEVGDVAPDPELDGEADDESEGEPEAVEDEEVVVTDHEVEDDVAGVPEDETE